MICVVTKVAAIDGDVYFAKNALNKNLGICCNLACPPLMLELWRRYNLLCLSLLWQTYKPPPPECCSQSLKFCGLSSRFRWRIQQQRQKEAWFNYIGRHGFWCHRPSLRQQRIFNFPKRYQEIQLPSWSTMQPHILWEPLVGSRTGLF